MLIVTLSPSNCLPHFHCFTFLPSAINFVKISLFVRCIWSDIMTLARFPQKFPDMEFPIDVAAAAQDHPRLERAVLNSLFRRLQVLNRCARVYQQRITHTDDSEDEQCALSDKWTFQSGSRRWSRNCQNIELRKWFDALWSRGFRVVCSLPGGRAQQGVVVRHRVLPQEPDEREPRREPEGEAEARGLHQVPATQGRDGDQRRRV